MNVPAEHLDVASVTALLERERSSAEGRGVLVFDADGTLWSGDIGNETFEATFGRGVIRAEALAALQDEARRCDAAVLEDASAQARALYGRFVEQRMDLHRAFAMMAWAFAGFTLDELDAFVSSVVREVKLADRLQRETVDVLSWARANGVPAYVVSASPQQVLEVALREVGLPTSGVLGVEPVVQGGIVRPSVSLPIPFDEGKVTVIERRLPGSVVLGAFGDSRHDVPMLGMSRVPVAVRPSPRLFERASLSPWHARLVVLT